MPALTLLFDSKCLSCSDIADDINGATNGLVKTRSLHDPDIAVVLDRIAPGWTFRPMLLVADGDETRVLVGFAMISMLAKHLGPRRAARLVGRLGGRTSASSAPGVSRRAAFRTAAAGGLAVFGMTALAKVAAASPSNPEAEAESEGSLQGQDLQDAVTRAQQSGLVLAAQRDLTSTGYDIHTVRASRLPRRGW